MTCVEDEEAILKDCMRVIESYHDVQARGHDPRGAGPMLAVFGQHRTAR